MNLSRNRLRDWDERATEPLGRVVVLDLSWNGLTHLDLAALLHLASLQVGCIMSLRMAMEMNDCRCCSCTGTHCTSSRR